MLSSFQASSSSNRGKRERPCLARMLPRSQINSLSAASLLVDHRWKSVASQLHDKGCFRRGACRSVVIFAARDSHEPEFFVQPASRLITFSDFQINASHKSACAKINGGAHQRCRTSLAPAFPRHGKCQDFGLVRGELEKRKAMQALAFRRLEQGAARISATGRQFQSRPAGRQRAGMERGEAFGVRLDRLRNEPMRAQSALSAMTWPDWGLASASRT